MGGSTSAMAVRSGYWKDHAHVEAELRRWMAQRGVVGRMPTQAELRASGAAALCVAVSSLGGIQGFAARLGRVRGCLVCLLACWPRAGLPTFLWSLMSGSAATTPSCLLLRACLLSRRQRARATALLAGAAHAPDADAELWDWAQRRLKPAHKEDGHWADFGNLRRELEAFAAGACARSAPAACHLTAPLQGAGEACGPSQPLAAAAASDEPGRSGAEGGGSGSANGRMPDVAELGVPASYSQGAPDPARHGGAWDGRGPGCRPASGRGNGLDAVPQPGHASAGGSAARIRGGGSDERVPADGVASTSGAGGGGVGMQRLPSQGELLQAGRGDLVHAIRLWGGATEVARLLGLPPRPWCGHQSNPVPCPDPAVYLVAAREKTMHLACSPPAHLLYGRHRRAPGCPCVQRVP